MHYACLKLHGRKILATYKRRELLHKFQASQWVVTEQNPVQMLSLCIISMDSDTVNALSGKWGRIDDAYQVDGSLSINFEEE